MIRIPTPLRRARLAKGVCAFLCSALLLALPVAAAGQDTPPNVPTAEQRLVGQVVHDGQPLAEVPVVLHRVTPDEAAPWAQTVTDEAGTFRFPLVAVPGAEFTLFFVTADYLSVRYFGHPINPDQPPASDYVVAVYDTTSTVTEPIRVVRRDMVMIPETMGSWQVNEIIRIQNPGNRALVATTPGMPAWRLSVPEGAAEFQVGQGEILPHEVSVVEGEVLLLAPVTPGARDLFIGYRLPANPGSASLPITEPTDTVNIFVRQPSHLTAVEGLPTASMVDAEGEQYLQYSGFDFPAGEEIRLEWTETEGLPVDPIVAAVSATLLLLGVGAWAAIRNRPTTAA